MSTPEQELGHKNDNGKAPWHLLPWAQVSTIVEVLKHGAKVYAPDNWKHVAYARDRYFSAAMRHLIEWREGELIDRESSLPHLAHAACCVLFLMWFDAERAASK